MTKNSTEVARLLWAHTVIMLFAQVIGIVYYGNVTELMTRLMGVPMVIGSVLMLSYIYFTYAKCGLFKSELKVMMPMKVFTLAIFTIITINYLISLFNEVFKLMGIDLYSSYNEAFGQLSFSWSSLLYIVILGPIVEEFVFRGVILRTFLKHGRNFAIVTSSVLFGLMHGNLSQFIVASLTGVVFGIIATRYGLRWSISLHVFNNALAVSLKHFGIEHIPSVGWLYLIIMVVTVFSLSYYRPVIYDYYRMGINENLYVGDLYKSIWLMLWVGIAVITIVTSLFI